MKKLLLALALSLAAAAPAQGAHVNYSVYTTQNFTVSAGTSTITSSGGGFWLYMRPNTASFPNTPYYPTLLATTGTLPSVASGDPLNTTTEYYLRKTTNTGTPMYLYRSKADARADTNKIVFTNAGTGTHTFNLQVFDHRDLTFPTQTVPKYDSGLRVGGSGLLNMDLYDGAVQGTPTTLISGDAGTLKARFNCEFSHRSYDDPIIFPGIQGATHLHDFFGNTGTNHLSTYETLRTTGESSCPGGRLNRSAYWMPTLMYENCQGDGVDCPVNPYGMLLYYQTARVFWSCNVSAFLNVNTTPIPGNPDCGGVVPLVRGMRLINGFDFNTGIMTQASIPNADTIQDTAKSFNNTNKVAKMWFCADSVSEAQWGVMIPNGQWNGSAYVPLANSATRSIQEMIDMGGCPPIVVGGVTRYADSISVRLNGRSCTNIVDTDSVDHRSHLPHLVDNLGNSISSGRPQMCPDTHPYQHTFILFEPAWQICPNCASQAAHLAALNKLYLSSDRHGRTPANWYPRGWTFHFDWFPAWEDFDPGVPERTYSDGVPPRTNAIWRWFFHCMGKHLESINMDFCDGRHGVGAYGGVPFPNTDIYLWSTTTGSLPARGHVMFGNLPQLNRPYHTTGYAQRGGSIKRRQ